VLRQLLEVFLSNLYGAAPARIGSELAPTIAAHMARPTLLASVVLVLTFATLAIREEDLRAEQAKRTLRLLHPYLSCNFGHVRVSDGENEGDGLGPCARGCDQRPFCGVMFPSPFRALICSSCPFSRLGVFFSFLSSPRQLVVQYLYHRLVTELGPPEWHARRPVSAIAASSSSSSTAAAAEPAAAEPGSLCSVDEESSCVSSLMAYLSAEPDLVRLRARQDRYFQQFNPWRGCTVQGLLANGDEHHHFLHRPLLDQIASVAQNSAANKKKTQTWRLVELQKNRIFSRLLVGFFLFSFLISFLSALVLFLFCLLLAASVHCRVNI